MRTNAAPTADRPNGPRSRKGAETRARLLDAAKQIFEENGFLEARISDIADRAGMSHGSFYHYFDSKEEVFREIAAAIDERLAAPLGAVILDSTSHATPSRTYPGSTQAVLCELLRRGEDHRGHRAGVTLRQAGRESYVRRDRSTTPTRWPSRSCRCNCADRGPRIGSGRPLLHSV